MIAVQFYWIQKAYSQEKSIFDSNVRIALMRVAQNILTMNQNQSPIMDIVHKENEHYYTVQINDHIDPVALESLLKRELPVQNIKTDFEFGIYDCASDTMQHHEYVNMQGDPSDTEDIRELSIFPKKSKDNYYFGVHFPNINTFLSGKMLNWIISTFVLTLFLIILAYAIFIIFKQKRLSEIQKDFVNNMTHEFKTPLATIKISSEVLKNPKIVNNPQRLLNYATIIANETEHLTNQVERVLQMAKSQKDNIELKKELIHLPLLINELLDKTYKPLVRSRGGDIFVKYSEENMSITADALHFKNVLGNLLDNAIKYCKVTPLINLNFEEKNNGTYIIVKDNGIGILPVDLKHIFDKFFRISTGNLHDVKGFGLGLNYVKLICKQHGGNITVKSEFGKGSEFCIFIPKL
jgi:two-component system phosphate regulon sensor histidine kinase PhoR